MITLNCDHADFGPVLVVTGEEGGFARARDAVGDPCKRCDVLTCTFFEGSLPGFWRDRVHALYREARPTFLLTAHPGVVDEVYFTDASDLRLRVLRWKGGRLENLSKDEAERLWRSYKVGIQHVSAILRTQGLYEGRCLHEFPGYSMRCCRCGEDFVTR